MKVVTSFFLIAIATSSFAGPLPDQNGIPFERFSQYPTLNGRAPQNLVFSPDGKKLVFSWNRTGVRKRDLYIMDFPAGEPKLLLDSKSVSDIPNQDDTRTEEKKKEQENYDGGLGGDAQFSPDGKEILLNYKGRTFTVSPEGKNLAPLFDGQFDASSFTYSLDNRFLLMIISGNLWRMERASGRLKQLTFITAGGASIDGYSVSPDSKNIGVSWSNENAYDSGVMMDFTKDRSQVQAISRMWQGNRAVDAQVGVVSMDGGMIKFMEGVPRFNWATGLSWSADSTRLAYGWNDEQFQNFTISQYVLSAGKSFTMYTEKAPKNYIPDFRPMTWTRDGKWLLLGTDILDGKFANRSVIKISPSGRDIQKVFAKNYDVCAMTRPINSDRIILMTQARSSLKGEIRILEPNGTETVHELIKDGWASGPDFDSCSLPAISDDGKSIASIPQAIGKPLELYSVEPVVKKITSSLLPEFAKVSWADVTEINFKAADGTPIHGYILTKPGLDKSIKHPAVIANMYANSGKMEWQGYIDNYMAVQLGMVVVKIDFRASWGQGGEFNSGYYKSMGIVDAQEAVAAKNYVVGLGYVNPNRCGVWGWSYGGFLTCMIMGTQPGAFHAGVAVASVTEWQNYNHWYTTRRLGLFSENAEAYSKSNPITYAKDIKGNFLLIHGMLDDNVLFQDSVRFSMKMIDSGVYFDEFFYPRDDHSIGKDETRPHVMTNIVKYLYEKLSQPE